MIQPEEIDRLASSGLAAIAADQNCSTIQIENTGPEHLHYPASDVVIEVAWYLHTRGLSKDAIDTILHDAIDKFDTEYKLPEGD